MKYYFVGIKGTGMSALAQLLQDEGNEVVGSDVEDHFFTEDILIKRNIPIYPFSKTNIDGTSFYVISTSYKMNHCEVEEIMKCHYAYLWYPDFLAAYLNHPLICVSGTHGKTSTTSFLTQWLDKKCRYVIGCGEGSSHSKDLSVVEACEYQNHFLAFHPDILIINSIEYDHPDFFKNKKAVYQSFSKIIAQSKQVILNHDQIALRKLKYNNNLYTYGHHEEDDFYVQKEHKLWGWTTVTIRFQEKEYLFCVPYTNSYLLMDAGLSFAACILLKKVTPNLCITKNLSLPSRRMETHQYRSAIFVNDYAHHPTEIHCLYESLREKYPEYTLHVIFQPHTYSRTIKLKREFRKVLSCFDEVYLEPVFRSREKESQKNQEKINRYFKCFSTFDKKKFDQRSFDQKEVWVFLGAGKTNEYMRERLNEEQSS